jgi:hypothetical protein
MNLLTNGFVNNYGRLFEPSEQFEADIVELGLKWFSVVKGRESRYPDIEPRSEFQDTGQLAVTDLSRRD